MFPTYLSAVREMLQMLHKKTYNMGYKTFSLKIDLKMSRLGKTLTVTFETISISLRENKKTMLLNSHKIFYSKQC